MSQQRHNVVVHVYDELALHAYAYRDNPVIHLVTVTHLVCSPGRKSKIIVTSQQRHNVHVELANHACAYRDNPTGTVIHLVCVTVVLVESQLRLL